MLINRMVDTAVAFWPNHLSPFWPPEFHRPVALLPAPSRYPEASLFNHRYLEGQIMKDNEKEGKNENGNSWLIAVVLMVVGLGLLVSNFTNVSFDNWWALFLFIPAGFMLKNVAADYKSNGRLTNKSTGPLIAGLAMLVMMVVFLFGLSWSGLWPLGLIFGGIAVLLGSRSHW